MIDSFILNLFYQKTGQPIEKGMYLSDLMLEDYDITEIIEEINERYSEAIPEDFNFGVYPTIGALILALRKLIMIHLVAGDGDGNFSA